MSTPTLAPRSTSAKSDDPVVSRMLHLLTIANPGSYSGLHRTVLTNAIRNLKQPVQIREFYRKYEDTLLLLDPQIPLENLVEIRRRAQTIALRNVSHMVKHLQNSAPSGLGGAQLQVWNELIGENSLKDERRG